jgi:hypothetical protein
MNKIQQDLLKAIEFNADEERCSEDCFEITKEHCIGFADFIETNKIYLHYWKSRYTTEQLFELYIKSLNNEQNNNISNRFR